MADPEAGAKEENEEDEGRLSEEGGEDDDEEEDEGNEEEGEDEEERDDEGDVSFGEEELPEGPKETARSSVSLGEPGLSGDDSEDVSSEEESEFEFSETASPTLGSIQGRDFEKEGPGLDKKYVLENVIGPLLSNLKTKSDKEWIMDNILAQMVDLMPGSPEYDMISELLDELLEDVVEEAEEVEEEEEKETTEEYLHYLIDMYCIPHRKEPFDITYEFLEACLHRLTDRRKELLLRGNDMMLYMHRRIGDDDLKLICDFVKSRPDVVTLDLAYNCITDFGMQIIADLLRDCPSLHRLNLMNNDFGAPGMQELAEIAGQLSLDTLRVAGNLIGVEGGIHAATLLKAKNNLLYLDVAQTSQRLQSLMDHIEALNTNDRLLYINFSRPLGEPMIGFDSGCWADAVGSMLGLNSTLREIYLQKSHFICHDMERLMLCAQHNRTLYLLDLSCNNVGDHGVWVLGEYLKTRPALIVLLLAHNNIADEGGRVLHYAIPNSRLQMLDVSYNRMTDRGIMSLITTLKKPTHLRALYMWGNNITHPTLQILKRHFRSKVLDPDGLDLRIYRVDDEDYVAYYPADRYNVLYYCVPRVRFDLFHYPPKRRPPAPPDIGRVCFRLPYHWRLEPLDLRCPDTGPHARVAHAPRFCWKPRPPLPPGVHPEFMKAQRAKRTFRELRFVLDEFGEVVDRRPGAGGPKAKALQLEKEAEAEEVDDDDDDRGDTGSSPASSPLGAASPTAAASPPSRASRGPPPQTRDDELGEDEEEEEEAAERAPSPTFTRKEIVDGEPFKERRLQRDFVEGPGEKPSALVEEKTRQTLESEVERKPVDGRGELYEREKGKEPPMEEFEARRSRSRGAEEKREEKDKEKEEGEKKKEQEEESEEEIEGEGEEQGEEEEEEEEDDEEEGREEEREEEEIPFRDEEALIDNEGDFGNFEEDEIGGEEEVEREDGELDELD